MLNPKDLDWHYGKVPNVEDVPYDCRIILWNEEFIGIIMPWGNTLNPLKWTDNYCFPTFGTRQPEGYWAWYEIGSEPRPPEVKTWAEMYETPEILSWKEHLNKCAICKAEDDKLNKVMFLAKTRMAEIKEPNYCDIGKKLLLKAYNGTIT